MLAIVGLASQGFAPLLPVVHSAPTVRVSGPVVMAEGQSRRAALLGLAGLAASAAPMAASATKPGVRRRQLATNH